MAGVTIADVRSKYPGYSDMSDTQLADALHSKFYADMPKEQFYAKVGLAVGGQARAEATGEPQSETSALSKRASNIYRELTTPIRRNVIAEGPQKLLRVAGEVGGAATDTGAGLVRGAYGMLPDFIQEGISGAGEYLLNTDIGKAQAKTASGFMSGYEKVREVAPESMKNIEAGLNIVGGIGVAKAVNAFMPAVKAAGGMAKRGAGAVVEKTKNVIAPPPSPDEALGQVLQGKTKDLPKGRRALAVIDTEGVKTYKDLKGKIDEGVQTYAARVDADLMRDPTPRPLRSLAISTQTAGGTTVTQNYVSDALRQLKELYKKVNDPVKAREIEELTIGAKTQGLTKKQVNDIARIYGNEYDAFNPSTGEQLASVNKKAYENTRKGLKETARVGMGDTAREADATLSTMLNTKRLIEKNIEAVNRIQQKVDPRSLGEKVGRAVGYALDWATGGTLKGLVGKFLPRGVGNKMLNALDLEENLERNLKILNRAANYASSKTKGTTAITKKPGGP